MHRPTLADPSPRRPRETRPRSSLALAWLALVSLLSSSASAQGIDTGVPEVERGVLGEPQLIEADVGANAELSSIVLFYRLGGEGEFAREAMRPTTRDGVYSATVPTRGSRADRLEFHIVAERESGRTLRRGSASTPLVRELVDPRQPDPLVSAPAGPDLAESGVETREPSGLRKYLYYGLGVLAVGALVAAASSDGGDGAASDEGCGDDGCTTTLIVNPLP